jgi:hypothetical protein
MTYEKLLLSGEQGTATLFANIMEKRLVICNKQGDGYLYNNDLMNYEKKLKCVLVDLVPQILIPIIDDAIYKLKEDMEYDDEDKLSKKKELKTIKKSLQTLRGCQTIYKTAIPKLLNINFKIPESISYGYKKETIRDEDYTQTILNFIKEKCIESNDKDCKIQPQVLYDSYKDYCKQIKVEYSTIQIFGKYITKIYGNKKSFRNFNNKIEKFYFGIKIF